MLKKYLYSGLLLLVITTHVGTVIKAEETPANVDEKNHLISVGWKYEGVAFKAN
ncbi:hypothetical protein K6V78_03530 [Streptococcus gallolyticus]|nr:hypothetical protein [Streptococcus gallolyticus]MBY5040710.1 hypothetical protein [Streptococcus gallolyticus]